MIFQQPIFTTLQNASPSPTNITSAEFFDNVYGPGGIIRLSNVGRLTIEHLRRHGGAIAENADIALYWPFPLKHNLVVVPVRSVKAVENVADWSYAVACFDDQET